MRLPLHRRQVSQPDQNLVQADDEAGAALLFDAGNSTPCAVRCRRGDDPVLAASSPHNRRCCKSAGRDHILVTAGSVPNAARQIEGSMNALLRLVLHVLLTWAVEAAALYVILRHVPGVTVEDWSSAIVAILAIGLLNALVRPAILLGAANFGVIPFLLIAFPLNAGLVLVAAWIVPGFDLHDPLSAVLVAVGLAASNALFSAMLSVNDDDSFYRNVIRRFSRRLAPTDRLDEPGTVVVQIDGLAEPILRRALGEGGCGD